MANPNIVSVATIEGGNLGFNLTATTTTSLVTVSSDYIMKINRIVCSNVDGTNAADVTLSVTKANYTPTGITNFDVSGTFFLAKTKENATHQYHAIEIKGINRGKLLCDFYNTRMNFRLWKKN